MAWGWSHTTEAYVNAADNVRAQSREWLEVVFAEWEAFEPEDHLDKEKYEAALARAAKLDDETLADHIVEKMEGLRTCTNGGWEAWACPYGCLSHMVSFDKEEGEENDPC